MGVATINRKLQPTRWQLQGRRASTTKLGSLLKDQIPIRTFAEWHDARPGFTEMDLVEDRGFVYQPQVVTSNQPITIGHAYSTMVLLPKKQPGDPVWVVPPSVRRVASDRDREQVGADQVQSLLTDQRLPFHKSLCVEVGGSSYSKRAYLAAHRTLPNLVTIARLRSNRVFYQAYAAAEGEPRKGHPRWYGERFALSDAETWHPPDEENTCLIETARGRTHWVHIQAWRNMLMRETRHLPMHRYPFTLVRFEDVQQSLLHLPIEGGFPPRTGLGLEQIPTLLTVSMVEGLDPVAHGLHVLAHNVGNLGAIQTLVRAQQNGGSP